MNGVILYILMVLTKVSVNGQNLTEPEINSINETKIISLSKTGCGKSLIQKTRRRRIVNGNSAIFGEFPWQVAIMSDLEFEMNDVACGGTLINNLWVISAAHCFDDYEDPINDLFVRLGEFDLTSLSEAYPHVDREFSELVIHGDYNSTTLEYDAALIKMVKPVEFQMHIQPICLPAKPLSLIGEFTIATGWGEQFEDGRKSAILQKVSLPIIRNKQCEKMLIKAGGSVVYKNIFLCAGYRHGKSDTCSGDSGGPLQIKTKDGKWVLAGIVSWGFGCAQELTPGLSTRVSLILAWIQKVTGFTGFT